MRRYWLPAECVQGELVTFDSSSSAGDVFHHIFDVCRQGEGSRFEVLVPGGKAHLVEVIEVGKKRARARIIETRVLPALPEPTLHLAISIPKFAVFEAVIEKCVELGVASVLPLYSEFSFIRRQADVIEKKLARWEKIVLSATQQTGRGDLMPILPAMGLEDWLEEFNRTPNAAGLFAYEGSADLALKPALSELRNTKPKSVWGLVGSEGGFSHREVELLRQKGLRPVTLGEQVLRVETACVALLSVIKYDFDQMR